MKEFIDETSEQNGTELNRRNLMAMQGIIGGSLYVDDQNNIILINSDNETKKITPLINGSRQTVYEGEKKITLTTLFADGKVVDVLS